MIEIAGLVIAKKQGEKRQKNTKMQDKNDNENT